MSSAIPPLEASRFAALEADVRSSETVDDVARVYSAFLNDFDTNPGGTELLYQAYNLVFDKIDELLPPIDSASKVTVANEQNQNPEVSDLSPMEGPAPRKPSVAEAVVENKEQRAVDRKTEIEKKKPALRQSNIPKSATAEQEDSVNSAGNITAKRNLASQTEGVEEGLKRWAKAVKAMDRRLENSNRAKRLLAWIEESSREIGNERLKERLTGILERDSKRRDAPAQNLGSEHQTRCAVM